MIPSCVNDDMKNVEDIRTRANNYMQLEEPYAGETEVLHFLEVLRDKVGFDKIRENTRFAKKETFANKSIDKRFYL